MNYIIDFHTFRLLFVFTKLETLSGNRRMERKWGQGIYYSDSFLIRPPWVGWILGWKVLSRVPALYDSLSWVFHNTSAPHPFKLTSHNSATVPASQVTSPSLGSLDPSHSFVFCLLNSLKLSSSECAVRFFLGPWSTHQLLNFVL